MSSTNDAAAPSYEEWVQAYHKLKDRYNRLRQTTDLYQIILYHAADMIAIVDTKGRRIWNNQAYYDTLGYTTLELEHSDSFAEIHPDDRPRVEKIFQETVQTGIARQTEYRMRHKDGHWLRLESRARAVTNEKGTVESIVLIARDITDRYLLEIELEQARSSATGGMISNRLGAVFDQTVDRLMNLVHEMRPHVAEAQIQDLNIEEKLKQSEHSHELLVSLLGMGHTTAEDRATLRMDALVTSAVKREIISGGMAREDIVIHHELMVRGSEKLLQQALEHIMRNAVESTEKRGVVRIELMRWILNREQAVQYGGLMPGEYAVTLVRDQGVGIEKEDIPRVCDPFYTTKPGHEGLGLTIADVVAVAHGGCLRIKSRRKISTEVIMLLPLVKAESIDGGHTIDARKSRTVLIMEPDVMVQSFLSRMLEDLGYQVNSVPGLREAAERVKRGADSRDFEMVDVIMGAFFESEDYSEWIDYMRNINSDLQCVLTHPDGNHPGVLRFQQYGFDAALVKPLTLENIRSTLDRVLDST